MIQSADEFDSEYVDDEEELSLKNSEKSSEVSGEHSVSFRFTLHKLHLLNMSL